ncbi:RF-1 domain-containing protein [Xylariaceae sp. FL1651]|nr:RF-1 domain-containing protein [Xylariaceae sp. FL1651]
MTMTLPSKLLMRLTPMCRPANLERCYVVPVLHLHDHVSSSSFNVSIRRQFSNTNRPPLLKTNSKNLPPRPKPPPEHEIEESFLKGSGPGGQKINKTNSAVQLKHLPTGLVVKCQATRSRSQNRTIARQLLADKLDDMARGDESRASVVGEVKRKKKASSAKKSRRKYRKLDEDRDAIAGESFEDENEHVHGDHGLVEGEVNAKADENETLDRR